MRCQDFQNEILASEFPDRLDERLSGHRDSCATCRAVWLNLIQLENSIRRYALPKAKPVNWAKPVAGVQKNALANKPEATSSKRRTWAMPTVAASLLLIGLWLVAGPSRQPALASLPPDPILELAVQTNLALADTQTAAPELKIKKLQTLFGALTSTMEDIARVDPTGEQLQSLSEFSRLILERGIGSLLNQMPEDSKQDALTSLKTQLSQVNRMAKFNADNVPPKSISAFKSLLESTSRMEQTLEVQLNLSERGGKL